MSKKFKMSKQFVLGTAQFSSNYGINNKSGKVNFKEGKKIINDAYNNGVRFLDTAVKYNNCDKILGRIGVKNWNVITKIVFPENKVNKFSLEKKIKRSLKNLKVKKFYGILIHNHKSLKHKFNKKNFNILLSLKKKKLVKKIGVSTYGTEDLNFITKNFEIDMIQTSFNFFDTRIVEYLKKNKIKKNIEIHGRSVFLNGLLLVNIKNLPIYFEKWKKRFKKLNNWMNKNNLNNLEACLNFGLQNTKFNKLVFGVDSSMQLKQIIKIIKYNKINFKFPIFRSANKHLIDPRTWPHRRKMSNSI